MATVVYGSPLIFEIAVEMKVWKAGDRENGERPTISIRLCAANAPRNSDQLVMKGKKAVTSNSEN